MAEETEERTTEKTSGGMAAVTGGVATGVSTGRVDGQTCDGCGTTGLDDDVTVPRRGPERARSLKSSDARSVSGYIARSERPRKRAMQRGMEAGTWRES